MQMRRSLLLASVIPLFLQVISSPSYAAGSCVPDETTLCLAGNRFQVKAMFGTLPASATLLTETSGGFRFLDFNNIDVAVKVLDASLFDGHFWVFRGGLSDLQYTVEVTDTASQPSITRIFTNPQGNLISERDFTAFDASNEPDIKAADLVANFEATVTNQSVSFTDLSTGQPDQWCWNFGDSSGSQCDSVVQNPTHPYAPGSYSVRLVVSREEGPASTVSEKTRTVTVTSQPPPPTCTFTLTTTSQPFGTRAANGQVTVKASSPSCPWTAVVSNGGFLKIRSGASGTGNGTVKYRVSANPCCPRSGSLTIANQQVTISQAGTCNFDPGAASIEDEGGEGSVSVIAPSGCAWTVSRGSGSDFLKITSGATGSGTRSVFYEVDPNPAATARTGSLSFDNVAGPKFSISQDPAPCKFSLAQRSQEIPREAGTYTVSVNAPASCPLTAESVPDSPGSFVTIDQISPSVTGGTVSYKVDANTGEARRQDLRIADKTFTVIQSGCASFERKQNLGASEGSGSITISASPSCTWEVKNLSPSFLTITSVTGDCDNGTLSFCGDGTVNFSVEANLYSLTRKGTLTISGSDFIVEQAGCASIESQSSPEEVPSQGDTRTVKITAPANCSWLAESDVDFIDILGDTSGSGNGEIQYSVSSTLLTRDGSLSIAGKTFKVHQEGRTPEIACIISGESDIQAFGPLGGISTLQVTAARSCSWSIGEDSTFMGTSTVATQGSGTVPFCVAANQHVQRSGLLAVSETDSKKTFFPITQEAPDSGDPTVCPTDDPTVLCLQDNRFEVRVTFGDAPNFGDSFHPASVGRSSKVEIDGSESEGTGYFSFSEGGDPELVVKILDRRSSNGSFWVYSGALTDRFYVITVTDTKTGRKTLFCNANGSFHSFGDTETLIAEP